MACLIFSRDSVCVCARARARVGVLLLIPRETCTNCHFPGGGGGVGGLDPLSSSGSAHDSAEIPQPVAFRMGVHFLPKHPFVCF